MQLDKRPRLVDGKLPVFVFPTELVYFADDRTSHKQVLTVYNPYDFTLKFKVLCTTRRRYAVVDSEGTIRPGCCVDVVIRHKDINEALYGSRDKFRLNIYEHDRRDAIGSKDIPSILLPTAQGRDTEADDVSTTSRAESADSVPFTAIARQRPATPGPIVVLLALVCITALLLPVQGEAESSLPVYLHLTINQKLIAAYVLGLVTMVILRT